MRRCCPPTDAQGLADEGIPCDECLVEQPRGKATRKLFYGCDLRMASYDERRGQDSNLRTSFPVTGLANPRFRPLSHLSKFNGPPETLAVAAVKHQGPIKAILCITGRPARDNCTRPAPPLPWSPARSPETRSPDLF